MADPKYANLPGIAYDQPDVYETKDLPEADQAEENFEEESNSIERLHLSVTDSFLKFKDKHISSQSVDFSDRLKKVPNRGYDARSGVWELAGQGEKETPLQKYQRLQCEMKELMEEVVILKSIVKEDAKDETEAYKAMAVHIEQAQRQLSEFRLEETLGPEVLVSLKDPKTAQIKKLIAHLESVELQGSKAGEKIEKQKTLSNQNETITYELRYHPDQIRLVQTSRAAELEQRLHKLENILGTSTESMSQNVATAVQNLSSRISLLEPSQIDAVESRLSVVAQKLDSIAEKIQSQADPEKDKKIAELYEQVKKLEPMSGMLPQTINRLKALESLHREASEFATSLSKLEAFQSKVFTNVDANEKLLQSVEKSFGENVEMIKKNMNELNQRLSAYEKK